MVSEKVKKKHPKLRWRSKTFELSLGRIRTPGWRLIVQAGFAILCIVMGWQFYHFVEAAKQTTSGALPYRPPGVEGFLPISGLMGVVDWFHQGTLNVIHPAATVLFLLFLLLSILLRKSFCGWICPVGFLSEWLARLGQMWFGRNFRLPSWLDYPLRSLKYLLLGFFAWAIFFSMDAEELHQFIASPYNKVADVKMLEFSETLAHRYDYYYCIGVALHRGTQFLVSLPLSLWCSARTVFLDVADQGLSKRIKLYRLRTL